MDEGTGSFAEQENSHAVRALPGLFPVFTSFRNEGAQLNSWLGMGVGNLLLWQCRAPNSLQQSILTMEEQSTAEGIVLQSW